MAVVTCVYVAEIASVVGRPIGFEAGYAFWSIGEASPAHKKEIQKFTTAAGVSVDMRPRIEVLAEMRAKGPDIVPAVQIGGVIAARNAHSTGAIDVDRLLPLGGQSRIDTLLCNESGEYVAYHSDEHGFRNPPGIWNGRRLDIAVVGQSFAQGYCVPDGKSFVDLLRAEYPRTLNLGVSGDGPLLQLATIREYLPRNAPRRVLWVFQEGLDLFELRDEMRLPLAMRYLQPGFTQHLLTRQREIDNALRQFATATEASEHSARGVVQTTSVADQWLGILKLWHLRSRLNDAFAVENARAVAWLKQSNYQPFTDILRQARDITNASGGRLYFVYLPSWSRYRHHAHAVDLERNTVLRVVEDLGIPYIDVHLAFQAYSDPLSLFPFRRFGHYNEDGNKVVAAEILKVLGRESTHTGNKSNATASRAATAAPQPPS